MSIIMSQLGIVELTTGIKRYKSKEWASVHLGQNIVYRLAHL